MIRTSSAPRSPIRRIASQSSIDVPMSDVAVMQKPSRISCAFCSAKSRSLGSGCGTAFSISPIAASTNTPDGSTPAFSIRPPAGVAVLAVTPAALIAALFAQAACPSARPSQTGRSATTASRSAAVGKRPSFHFSWFQPPPTIHFLSGLA